MVRNQNYTMRVPYFIEVLPHRALYSKYLRFIVARIIVLVLTQNHNSMRSQFNSTRALHTAFTIIKCSKLIKK